MRQRAVVHLMLFCVILVAGCASPSATVTTESKPPASLPASVLAKYNDTFDRLREDQYETVTSTWNKEQLANFKLADMAIEDGQLVIRTKTGCFSRAALATKYLLRGDFDIQIDCHVDFLKQANDMDQLLYLMIASRQRDRYDIDDRVVIGPAKFGNDPKSWMVCHTAEGGRARRGNSQEIAEFHGTLRAVRTGNKVTVLYRNKGDQKWIELDSFSFTTADAGFSFAVTNFAIQRTTITASASITARFDNLIINAAQEIVESEI